MVGDKTNNKNQLSVVSLKNDIEKITIFFIKRIIENFNKLNLKAYKRRTDACGRYLKAYIRSAREFFIPSNNYLTGNTAFLLLPKLLFKDLSIINDLYRCRFGFGIRETRLTNCNTKEDVEKYLRIIKINFVSYCKILLKEFDLIKFYKQCTKISNIKLDDNFSSYNLKPDTLQKVKKINSLLKYIHHAVKYYDHTLFTIYSYFSDDRLGFIVRGLPPIFYYIAFYYYVKLVKSLLKQYKEVMRNDELKKNMNMRLFTHFSIILIFMCLEEVVTKVEEFMYKYFYNYSLCEHRNMEDFEKILNKTVEILNEFHSVIFKGKEEKDMSLLIATCTKHPYIDSDIYSTISNCISVHARYIRQGVYEDFMPLLNRPSNVVNSEKYLQAKRITHIADKLHSTVSSILWRFDVMVEASSRR